MKSADTPWYRAVPFMLIVAPRGRTKLAMSSGTPRFSVVHWMVTGRVAELELVLKAMSCACWIPLRKRPAGRPAKSRTIGG